VPARGEIHVLLAVGDVTLEELLTELLEKTVGSRRVLKITARVRAEEILASTAQASPDIFVLVLNNIIHPDENVSVGPLIDESLRMVDQLKEQHRRPVIALLGLPVDASIQARAQAVGIDFLLPLPFALGEFERVVEACFSQTGSASGR